MKLADALQGVSRLGIDTAPLIYLVEANGPRDAVVFEVFRHIDDGRLLGITSVISLAEVLVHPIRMANAQMAQRYRELLLESRGFRCHDIDERVAERAARLRAMYSLRLPDALQLAVAIVEGCDAFLTNDRSLTRVRELPVLIVDDLES